MWGMSVEQDQQIAGAVMKVGGGIYLWVLIAIRFFKHSSRQMTSDLRSRRVNTPGHSITYEDLEREFEKAGPPPVEIPPNNP